MTAITSRSRPVPIWLESLLRDRGIQLLSLGALLLVWALLSYLIGTFGGHSILPGPLEVAPRFAQIISSGAFVGPLTQTLRRTAYGFAIAFVVGLVVGIASARVPIFKTITSPTITVLLFAPTLVAIYLGTAMGGVSDTMVAFLSGLLVLPNASIYMRDIMGDFDPELSDMADSYKIPTRQRFFDVYLPYLVPPMLAASRLCFSQAWKIVSLTEVFGLPGGLGFEIRSSYYIFDLPRMFSFLMVFVITLLVIEQGIRILEHLLVKWQR